MHLDIYYCGDGSNGEFASEDGYDEFMGFSLELDFIEVKQRVGIPQSMALGFIGLEELKTKWGQKLSADFSICRGGNLFGINFLAGYNLLVPSTRKLNRNHIEQLFYDYLKIKKFQYCRDLKMTLCPLTNYVQQDYDSSYDVFFDYVFDDRSKEPLSYIWQYKTIQKTNIHGEQLEIYSKIEDLNIINKEERVQVLFELVVKNQTYELELELVGVDYFFQIQEKRLAETTSTFYVNTTGMHVAPAYNLETFNRMLDFTLNRIKGSTVNEILAKLSCFFKINGVDVENLYHDEDGEIELRSVMFKSIH